MKEKLRTYENKMNVAIKSLNQDGGRVAKDASAALAHTLEFQNLLVEGVSAKFDSVEKRLDPLEAGLKMVNDVSLPEIRTEVRSLSSDVRNALTNANSAKESAESVKKELEAHTSSDETARKLTTLTKALDDIGQELKGLAQKVASLPGGVQLDLGAMETMIKDGLIKLGFLPAGPVAVQKAVKETISSEQIKLDAAVSNLEDELTLAYTDLELPSPLLNSEDATETRLQSIEKGMQMLMGKLNEKLKSDIPWDYVPKATLEERVEGVQEAMLLVKETVELAK